MCTKDVASENSVGISKIALIALRATYVIRAQMNIYRTLVQLRRTYVDFRVVLRALELAKVSQDFRLEHLMEDAEGDLRTSGTSVSYTLCFVLPKGMRGSIFGLGY